MIDDADPATTPYPTGQRRGMFPIAVGDKIDKALRRNLVVLLQALSADMTTSGGGRAGNRIDVLAPDGVVTQELFDFAHRAFAALRPHCMLCAAPAYRYGVLCAPCARRVTASMPNGGVNVFDADDFEAMCLSKNRYGHGEHAAQMAELQSYQCGIKLFTYLCPLCAGYHLTRQSQGPR